MFAFLTVRNQHSSLVAMVSRLQAWGLDVVILDNASEYPPLLEYYERRPCEVIRYPRNGDHKRFWGLSAQVRDTGPVVISDPDLDLAPLPDDWLERCREGLAAHPECDKIGPSLRLSDLPDTPVASRAKQYESRYWRNKRGAYWVAPIDTTLHLLRDGMQPFRYDALRLDEPYSVRHLPWYEDPDALSEEFRYYLDRVDRRVSYWGNVTLGHLSARDAPPGAER